jgi:hypothetical protein
MGLGFCLMPIAMRNVDAYIIAENRLHHEKMWAGLTFTTIQTRPKAIGVIQDRFLLI